MRSQIERFPYDGHMTDFHQRLRQLRTARKLTQTRMAELLEVSPRVYTRWDNGDSIPQLGAIVKIANILNVSIDELAGRTETDRDAAIHNPELHRLYKKVDQLSDEDQKAFLKELVKFGTNSEHVVSTKLENTDLESYSENKPFILNATVKASELVERAGNKILVKI